MVHHAHSTYRMINGHTTYVIRRKCVSILQYTRQNNKLNYVCTYIRVQVPSPNYFTMGLNKQALYLHGYTAWLIIRTIIRTCIRTCMICIYVCVLERTKLYKMLAEPLIRCMPYTRACSNVMYYVCSIYRELQFKCRLYTKHRVRGQGTAILYCTYMRACVAIIIRSPMYSLDYVVSVIPYQGPPSLQKETQGE